MELTNNVTLIVFVVAMLLSRYINSTAIKKLSMEKKAELLDGFSGFSVWSILPLLVIIGIFYFATDYIENNHLFYLSIFLVVAGIYVIGIQVYIYKKLRKMDYPMSYIKQYILSVLVRFIGLFALLSPMIIVFVEN
jgi:uncharacterized membrane protein YoaK (UPF0700 family)